VQRETLDNLHEGVAVIGGDGRLKLFNPAYCRIWGFDPERLADSPPLADLVEQWRRFFPLAGDWEVRRARLMGELAERRPSRGVMTRGDGTAIEYSSVPLPDGATLFTYVDVTDRLRVETVLRERNIALETADRLKTEFIANVSYELRTPLNTILGFAEILANQYFGELTPRQLEYSRGILESSHRLLALINDILDLATIEAGYMALERIDTELHGLLANVLSLMRERARNQQLSLLFDCAPNIGALSIDPRRIKQALFNLLSNAFKFTPPGGTVTLAARREAGEVLFTVSDTGVGIPEQDQARVFDRFERATKFGRHSGAGLGLSLVKSFVELHGGRVDMSSIEGQGTTVVCHLPIVTRVDTGPTLPVRAAAPSSLPASD
jgi:signal transduction histidine kinase